MEKDNELKGNGNSYDFGARIYDPRLGRWLAIDPLNRKYPSLSPYQFTDNNPILLIDPDGRIITFPNPGGEPIVYTPNMKADGYSANNQKAILALNVLYSNSDVFKANIDKLTASDVKYNIDINDNHNDQNGDELMGGETLYDFNKKQVNIKIDPSKYPNEFYAMLGDELRTGEQFEDGEIGFFEAQDETKFVGITGYDLKDELETKIAAVNAAATANKAGFAKQTPDPFSKGVKDIYEDNTLKDSDKNKKMKDKFAGSSYSLDNFMGKNITKQTLGNMVPDLNKTMEDSKAQGSIRQGVYRKPGKDSKMETQVVK